MYVCKADNFSKTARLWQPPNLAKLANIFSSFATPKPRCLIKLLLKTVFLLCLNKIFKNHRRFRHVEDLHGYGAEAAEQWSNGVAHAGVQGHPQASWNGTGLAKRVITSDKQWIFEYDPETKYQSIQWTCLELQKPKKQEYKSKIKFMLITVFNVRSIKSSTKIPERHY